MPLKTEGSVLSGLKSNKSKISILTKKSKTSRVRSISNQAIMKTVPHTSSQLPLEMTDEKNYGTAEKNEEGDK